MKKQFNNTRKVKIFENSEELEAFQEENSIIIEQFTPVNIPVIGDNVGIFIVYIEEV